MAPDVHRHVRRFIGGLESSNASIFFEAVVEDCNWVVGLEMCIQPVRTTACGVTITLERHDNDKGSSGTRPDTQRL